MWSLVIFMSFLFHVYKLFDPGSTLSFVTHLVESKIDLLHEILHEPFLVNINIGDNIRAKRVYRVCGITFLDRVTYDDLIESTMIDFSIFLLRIGSINALLP